MSSNYRRNKAFIDKFRKELQAMLDDISEIDERVLNKAVSVGLADAKKNTPVGKYPPSSGRVGGFMRKSWAVTPTKKTASGAEKSLINKADYSSYVNYGHRIVNRKGETVGWVPGSLFWKRPLVKWRNNLLRNLRKKLRG